MEKLLDKEFKVLRIVRDHPNIAKIYALQKRKAPGGWEARELMELCPIGLFDYLKVLEKDHKYLPEQDIWEMMYDMVNAIGFMHKQDPPLVHRDLKLENVMQGKDGRWKLIDFGSVVFGTVKLATKEDVDREEEQIEKYTTQMYRAPEMVDFFGVSEITPKTDIWALGCILYTLMFLKQPFLNASKLAILGAKYTIPPRHRYSPELVDLLKRMLTPDPEKRASAVELFKTIKAKVGKRVPRRVQMVASNFHDDAVSEDVTVSIAHTTADYDTAMEALRRGARQATHLFNAMPAFTHRAPGVVGAAFDNPQCNVELISDGVHIHPSVVRSVFKLFGAKRVILISDTMRAAGMPDGDYTLGGQDVKVQGKYATLADGTLAGSVTDLMNCMKTAVSFGVPLADAVRAAAVNPARVLGIFDRVGSLTAGKRANVVILDNNLDIKDIFFFGAAL